MTKLYFIRRKINASLSHGRPIKYAMVGIQKGVKFAWHRKIYAENNDRILIRLPKNKALRFINRIKGEEALRYDYALEAIE